MAYALKFDGATNRISLSAAIANPLPIGESITFNGKWKNSGKTFQMFIDLYTSGSDFIGFNTSGQLYTRISNNIKVGTLALNENQEFEFVISRTPSQYDLTLNGVFQYSHLKTTNLATLDGFSNQTYDFEGEMYDCTVGTTNLYDATASNHEPGTVTLTDTVGGNDGIGQNFPTDGSAWIDLGGGGVTVTELLNNSDSTSNQDSILLSGLFNVIDDVVGSDSLSSIDNISLAATVNISDEKDDSVSASNEDGIKLSGVFNVGELENNTLSLSSFDSIQLVASIVINETESSSLSQSNNDNIKLIGLFNVIGEKNNTSSVSNIDLVSLASTIIINDNLTNTDSISNLDGISFVGKIVISDIINDSSSLSTTDSILLAGAVSIGDTLNDTKSLSIFDSIQVGEFLFNVNTETNVDGIYLAINVNGIYYSTNLNG